MLYNLKCSKCKYFENRGNYCWCQYYQREVTPDAENECCIES